MVLVVGSTGNTGSALCSLLAARGVPFRALTRDPIRARAVLGPAADLVTADVTDRAAIDAALRGVDAVYAALGGTPHLLEAERMLIDAASRAGVRHYVKLSGVEVRPALATIQKIHAAAEAHLASSGMPWTVLGGNFFFQNFLAFIPAIRAGVLPLPTGARRAALVDVADIANAAACVLTTAGHEGRRYRMTGPASLSHADAAAIFTDGLGHPVQHVDVPPAAFQQAGVDAGLPPWLAEQLTDIYTTFFGEPGAAAVSDDIARLTSTPPRDLAAWVRANRAVFGPG